MTVAKLKRILEQCKTQIVTGRLIQARDIAKLIRLALAAREVSKATHEWNDSVRTIIGRDAKSGIDLVALDAALAAVFGEGDDHE